MKSHVCICKANMDTASIDVHFILSFNFYFRHHVPNCLTVWAAAAEFSWTKFHGRIHHNICRHLQTCHQCVTNSFITLSSTSLFLLNRHNSSDFRLGASQLNLITMQSEQEVQKMVPLLGDLSYLFTQLENLLSLFEISNVFNLIKTLVAKEKKSKKLQHPNLATLRATKVEFYEYWAHVYFQPLPSQQPRHTQGFNSAHNVPPHINMFNSTYCWNFKCKFWYIFSIILLKKKKHLLFSETHTACSQHCKTHLHSFRPLCHVIQKRWEVQVRCYNFMRGSMWKHEWRLLGIVLQ